jgi:hypothetical protein
MEKGKPRKLPRPLDDRPIWNVLSGIWGYPAVLVAHELKFFELLADKPLTLDEICAEKQVEPRPAHALLAVGTSLGLITLRGGRYSLTPLSRQSLLPSSPYYVGGRFDEMRFIMSVWSPDSVRDAVLTNRPQGVFSDPAGVFAAWHGEHALTFTRAMHSASIAPAMEWPRKLSLSRHRVMLDIGGGSGAHSIGAVTIYPKLRAVVMDRPPICEIAHEFAQNHGVADRVSTYDGDFFQDPFPSADLHFYGLIFHDWPPEQDRLLAAKSFESLPAGGRIVIHEMLFNDERSGPFPVAAYNINMLVGMPGQQYSGCELRSMLSGAGFRQVEVKRTFGYWSIVTGIKP